MAVIVHALVIEGKQWDRMSVYLIPHQIAGNHTLGSMARRHRIELSAQIATAFKRGNVVILGSRVDRLHANAQRWLAAVQAEAAEKAEAAERAKAALEAKKAAGEAEAAREADAGEAEAASRPDPLTQAWVALHAMPGTDLRKLLRWLGIILGLAGRAEWATFACRDVPAPDLAIRSPVYGGPRVSGPLNRNGWTVVYVTPRSGRNVGRETRR